MIVARHSPITQGQMDSLASLANQTIPSQSRSNPTDYLFATGSHASASFWFKELNRIRGDYYRVVFSPSQSLAYTSYTDTSVTSRGYMPGYIQGLPRAFGGPWLCGQTSELVQGRNKWVYEDVSYVYSYKGSSQKVLTKGYIEGGFSIGNTLGNYKPGSFNFFSNYVPATRIEFRIGGDTDVNFTSYSGSAGKLSFTLYYSSSATIPDPCPNPTITVDTNIPNYNTTQSFDLTGGTRGYGTFTFGIANQTLTPNNYYIQLSVSPSPWEFYNQGRGACGGAPSGQDTWAISVESETGDEIPGVTTSGTVVKKINAPKVSQDGSWPFGIYWQYGPQQDGRTYVDCIDGIIKKAPGSPNPGGKYAYYFNYSAIKWAALPGPTGSDAAWYAKTHPIISDGVAALVPLDKELPHTYNTTTKYRYSRMRAKAEIDITATITASKSPALIYGLGSWPTLANNQPLTFGTASLPMQINSIVAHRPTSDNGSGFRFESLNTGSNYNVYLSYYSGSQVRHLDTIIIPSGSSSYCAEKFYPIMNNVPIIVSSAQTGSSNGTQPYAELFVSAPLGYIGLQDSITANRSRIPWYSNYYDPVSACYYNDLYSSLQNIQNSINE